MMKSVALTDSVQQDDDFVLVDATGADAGGATCTLSSDLEAEDDDYDYCDDAFSPMSSLHQSFTATPIIPNALRVLREDFLEYRHPSSSRSLNVAQSDFPSTTTQAGVAICLGEENTTQEEEANDAFARDGGTEVTPAVADDAPKAPIECDTTTFSETLVNSENENDLDEDVVITSERGIAAAASLVQALKISSERNFEQDGFPLATQNESAEEKNDAVEQKAPLCIDLEPPENSSQQEEPAVVQHQATTTCTITSIDHNDDRDDVDSRSTDSSSCISTMSAPARSTCGGVDTSCLSSAQQQQLQEEVKQALVEEDCTAASCGMHRAGSSPCFTQQTPAVDEHLVTTKTEEGRVKSTSTRRLTRKKRRKQLKLAKKAMGAALSSSSSSTKRKTSSKKVANIAVSCAVQSLAEYNQNVLLASASSSNSNSKKLR